MLASHLGGSPSNRRRLGLTRAVAQSGPDVFGAEAAASHFYGVSAARLTARQAAGLAAGLSRPHSWNPSNSSRGYRHRVDLIRGRMRRARWVLGELGIVFARKEGSGRTLELTKKIAALKGTE